MYCANLHNKSFLKSLGLHNSVIALVWVGGPLCGAVLQPYFGLLAENCSSRWGRRRPYIAGGTAAVVISLLSLAYISTSDEDSDATRVGAIVGMTSLNIGIQPLQGSMRALLVDASPPELLPIANAWASRLTSMANILGYVAGFLDLSQSVPFALIVGKRPQFFLLCIFSAAVLACTVTLTCLFVHEEPNTDVEQKPPPKSSTWNVMSQLTYLASRFHYLPRSVLIICFIQSFSWLAWTPFLYYISLYVLTFFQIYHLL